MTTIATNAAQEVTEIKSGITNIWRNIQLASKPTYTVAYSEFPDGTVALIRFRWFWDNNKLAWQPLNGSEYVAELVVKHQNGSVTVQRLRDCICKNVYYLIPFITQSGQKCILTYEPKELLSNEPRVWRLCDNNVELAYTFDSMLYDVISLGISANLIIRNTPINDDDAKVFLLDFNDPQKPKVNAEPLSMNRSYVLGTANNCFLTKKYPLESKSAQHVLFTLDNKGGYSSTSIKYSENAAIVESVERAYSARIWNDNKTIILLSHHSERFVRRISVFTLNSGDEKETPTATLINEMEFPETITNIYAVSQHPKWLMGVHKYGAVLWDFSRLTEIELPVDKRIRLTDDEILRGEFQGGVLFVDRHLRIITREGLIDLNPDYDDRENRERIIRTEMSRYTGTNNDEAKSIVLSYLFRAPDQHPLVTPPKEYKDQTFDPDKKQQAAEENHNPHATAADTPRNN